MSCVWDQKCKLHLASGDKYHSEDPPRPKLNAEADSWPVFQHVQAAEYYTNGPEMHKQYTW